MICFVVQNTRKRENMDAAYHQMMLERQEQLEIALYNAQSGKGTIDDWAIIRFECGALNKPIGKSNDNHTARD